MSSFDDQPSSRLDRLLLEGKSGGDIMDLYRKVFAAAAGGVLGRKEWYSSIKVTAKSDT